MPLPYTGPRRLLQIEQLSKKIVANKSMHYILLLVTTLFKRNPQQAPSREENHVRSPHRISTCTHAQTQTHRDQCIYPKSSHIRSHFRSYRSHGGGGSSTCRSTAFAAVWIHHLRLPLPSSLKVKFQSD